MFFRVENGLYNIDRYTEAVRNENTDIIWLMVQTQYNVMIICIIILCEIQVHYGVRMEMDYGK